MKRGSFNFKSRQAGVRVETLKRGAYRCAFCRGEGVVPTQRKMACSACSGTGKVRVVSWAVFCAYCRGQGKSVLNRSLPCVVCRGKGVIEVSRRSVQCCLGCRGRGMARGSSLPCVMCRGSGVDVRLMVRKGVIPWKKTRRKRKTRTRI